MSLPPETIAPDALWIALQEMPRPQRVIDFPRRDPVTGETVGQVIVRVLTESEQMSAAAAAEEHTVKVMKNAPRRDAQSQGYDTIYNNESSVQLLFRAVLRLKPEGLPFFPSPQAMRDNLTNEEMGALVRTYLIVQRELGPIVSQMQAGEMNAWVETLAKGGSSYPLALLESEAQTELLMLMASRLYAYSTGTTSSGSPPDASNPRLKPLDDGHRGPGHKPPPRVAGPPNVNAPARKRRR